MLGMVNLPKSFCGEAINTIDYLINRFPLDPLNFEILERVWIGKDISYSCLKVFCYKAFMNVPKEQRSKLDNKATPYMYDMMMRNLAINYGMYRRRKLLEVEISYSLNMKE